jgi:dTDP-4-amino-4,6-dideoxygalactose transaminase
MIPIFSNTLGDEELEAVSNAFKTRWVGKGKQCDAFERAFAQHLQVPRVLLLNNCTAAIYAGLWALGIGPGDEVIISTVNFVATAGAVIDVGATPVFADVDPRTLNILPSEIERLTTKRTRAVFLLHYGGHPCPMDGIRAACRDGLLILEDSANSVSSLYKGRMCGTLGSAGFWSFDAMKILVMVDGGALYLHDDEAFDRAKVYRYLGLVPKTTSGMDAMGEKQTRWWEYELAATSGRFISNDVLAAIGQVQLKKLPEFIARRKQVWEYYQSELAGVAGLVCPPEPLPDTTGSYYLYWIQVPKGRDELAVHLAENSVYTTFRYFPLHLVKYYDTKCRLPNAERINETTLNLPLHQNLSDGDVQKIVDLVRQFFA